MHPLHSKVALITGGSSGIGRATALRLASFGARVAVAARTVAALEETVRQAEALGVEALAVPTDVTDIEQCRRAVETTVAHFGRLDVLVCSAGVSMRGLFAEAEPTVLEQVMRINFFGTLYPTYFAIPHVKRSRGSLVAISSLTGKRGTPSYAIYSASKFAVRGLYESLRLELARDGVHVGVVSPGFVATPLRQRVLDGRRRPSLSGRSRNASIASSVSSSSASRRRWWLAPLSSLFSPWMKSAADGSATGIWAVNSCSPNVRVPIVNTKRTAFSPVRREDAACSRHCMHSLPLQGLFAPRPASRRFYLPFRKVLTATCGSIGPMGAAAPSKKSAPMSRTKPISSSSTT